MSTDAERSVLGGVLLDNGALADIAYLSAADFAGAPERLVYEAMLSLGNDGRPIDRVTLKDELGRRGTYRQSGGEDFIDLLDKIVPSASNVGYYARIVHDAAGRRKASAHHARLSQRLATDPTFTAADALEAIRNAETDRERQGRSEQLDGEWKTIEERGGITWFTEEPPPRAYLLRSLDGRAGLYGLGDSGVLAAAGAGGKTWAMILLALCVAASEDEPEQGRGLKWLDAFEVARGGRVLLAMAEEDEGELRRRLYHGAQVLGLNRAQLARAARRIVALPLVGCDVSLTADPAAGEPAIVRTRFAVEVERRLAVPGDPWALLIFDPWSRFAGADVEKDNRAATRFVQVLEGFAKIAPGHPSVLSAHHTNKGSRGTGDDGKAKGAGAESIRGVTGLIDAPRWAAMLESEPRPAGAADDVPDLLTFRVVKSNHGRASGQDVQLVRDDAHHGCLRRPTLAEAKLWEKAAVAAKEAKDAAGKGGKPAQGNGKQRPDVAAIRAGDAGELP